MSLFACAANDSARKQSEHKQIGSTLHGKQSLPLRDIPASALVLIKSVHPEFVPEAAEKEFKHDNFYLDVEGDLAGAEIEFDMLQTPDGWQIVEVQRDLGWNELPASVVQELARKQPGFKPSRIIESIQHGTAITIYELYAVDDQGVESKAEVMLEAGAAKLLQEEWRH